MDSSVFLDNIISFLPLIAFASFVNISLISLIYIFGALTANDKTKVWARVELLDSLLFIAFILILLSVFPILTNISLGSLYSTANLQQHTSPSGTVFDGAELYFSESLGYVDKIITMARYHVAAFYMLESRYLFNCDAGESTLPAPFNVIISNCFFGNGGSGLSPFAGVGFISQSFYALLQSAIIAKLSLIINLIIYRLALTTMPLFLLPVGIFFRVSPFLRKTGALMISIVLSFMIIYPVLFAILEPYVNDSYEEMIGFTGFDPDSIDYGQLDYLEQHFGSSSFSMPFLNPSGALPSKSINDDELFKKMFNERAFYYDKFPGALAFGALAFFLGLFLPNLVLFATVASLYYITRTLGVQVDFMRMTFLI